LPSKVMGQLTCLAVHPRFDNGMCRAVICGNFVVHTDKPAELLHDTLQTSLEVDVGLFMLRTNSAAGRAA
jgi:hypothetical protein